MCWINAVAQGVLGVASSIIGYQAQVQQAAAQGEAAKANAESAIKQMNREFQNYEAERSDAFDAAVNEIIKTRLNAQELNAQVEAAVAETMEGRTADIIRRKVKGDEARTVASIQENYERKSDEIDLNKETTLLNTKDYVSKLKVPEAPSPVAAALGAVSAIIGADTMAKTARADAISKGAKWDFWKGAV